MRLFPCFACVLILATGSAIQAKKSDPQWSIGKILDENRARYFAGMLNDSSSNTTESGTLSGTAYSTSLGDSTNTQINGGYSGTRRTSSSGTSIPIYRVYDNLVIEGSDSVYITSERIRWRWSKGAHVAVNGTIKYYVDGRKLHVLDDDNREHTMEIVKEIRKVPATSSPVSTAPPDNRQTTTTPMTAGTASLTSVSIDSTPPGADIEVDGSFVGNTPSTVAITPGSHQIAVKKKGFADWTKTLNVTGGTVHLNAELEIAPVLAPPPPPPPPSDVITG